MEMFFKMKNYFGFYVLAVLIMTDGFLACFQADSTSYHYSLVGSSFYAECICNETGYTVEDLHWVDINGDIIQHQGPGIESNVYTEQSGDALNLVIRSTSKAMSGTYKCATNFNAVGHVQAYEVTVYDKMEFIKTPTSQYLVEGDNSTISCQTSPRSSLMSWAKGENEYPLNGYSDKYRITNDGLYVMNVTIYDADTYKCTAYPENGDGGDKYIEVEVYTLPNKIELHALPEATVGVGENLMIKCKAEGSPNPVYTWRKISKSKKDESGNATWVQTDNSITFDRVRADDRGTYECTASNVVGTVKKEIIIDVLVRPEIINFHNITAVENPDGLIPIICNATGNPDPNVTIVYMGKRMTKETDTEYERLVPNFSSITADRKNDGIYVCNATNTVDYETDIMYLRVLHKPYFKEQRELVWAWNGSTINLSCHHESSPAANVTWSFKKGNTEESVAAVMLNMTGNVEKTFILDEKNFSDELSPYGEYTCKAVNEYGEAEKIIVLRKGYPPSVVQNATVIEVTATSAKFAIQMPEEFTGPDIIAFMAEYDEEQNYAITNIHQNRTWSLTWPFRLEKLKANTSYAIRFAAINQVGTGPWSENIDFDTLEKSVPEPPMWPEEALRVISNKKLLRWKAAEDNGDPIDFYKLRYCPIYGELDEKLCKTIQIEPTTQLELSNLEYNTSYYLSLVAHNSEGFSVPANTSITVSAASPQDALPLLSAGVLIGISALVVVICLLLLDLLLCFWRKQGIIAACYYKNNKKKKTNDLNNSRDKKGLLKDNRESSGDDALRRANNGHREYEYNKTTGVITGKHSAV